MYKIQNYQAYKHKNCIIRIRDVTTGATGATEVAPKFSDTLTLSQLRGADSAHLYRGRSKTFSVVTSLPYMTLDCFCSFLGELKTQEIYF